MFSRITSALLVIFLAFAVASATTITVTKTLPPAPTATPAPASSCNTGDLQCCNDVQAADSPIGSVVNGLLTLLGLILVPVNANVGLTCSPLSIVGGSSSCTAQPVCCENNNFQGLVALGCNPINVSL